MTDGTCLICSANVTKHDVEETFPVGYEPVNVTVLIPAYHCIPCDFGWSGEEAEKIRDKAAMTYIRKG